MKKYAILAASVLFATLLHGTLCAGQNTRYFKAEHGVAATYIKLAANGRYKVIDREHMGVGLTDDGHWRRNGALLTFSPTNPKKTSYQATENKYQGKVFLAITTVDAAAGIVITAEDTKKNLDADPNYLPDHVFFKISPKTYNTEIKENYPFHYIGKEH
jgi:hypothetical protein